MSTEISRFTVDDDVAEAIDAAVAKTRLPGVRTVSRATWLRIAIMNQLKLDGIKVK